LRVEAAGAGKGAVEVAVADAGPGSNGGADLLGGGDDGDSVD
jgi:hypothetical protein